MTDTASQAPSLTLADFRNTMFLPWLNRNDATQSQANLFIQRGLARCNREIRIPQMERDVTYTSDDGTPFNTFDVPKGFLSMRQMIGDTQFLYKGATLQEVLQHIPYSTDILGEFILGVSELGNLIGSSNQTWCSPFLYARKEGSFIITPSVSEQVQLLYVAAFDPLVNDTDTNGLLNISPECLMFAALSYAASFYRDSDAATDYETRYQTERDTLNQVGQDMDYLGMPMQVHPLHIHSDW